jgi:hypothetical protein
MPGFQPQPKLLLSLGPVNQNTLILLLIRLPLDAPAPILAEAISVSAD